MKKRRIMATIAAFAVAAAGFFIPSEINKGFNIEASAAVGDVITTGGLKLEYTDDDGNVVNDFDFSILAVGDEFKLIIDVPKLQSSLPTNQQYTKSDGTIENITGDDRGLDVAAFTIDYDPTAFELVQWYTAWQANPNWPDAGETLGGTAGETNADEGNGKLHFKVTSNGTLKINRMFIKDAGQLEAIFKVRNTATIETPYTFKFSEDEGEEIDFSYSDADGYKYHKIWDPNNKSITASVASSLTGTVTGYDTDDGDIDIYMFSSYLWDPTLPKPNKVIPKPYTSKDGTFIFRGIEKDTSYKIYVNKWCRYENKSGNTTSWSTEGYKVTADTTTLGSGVTVKIRLYGDVTNDGSINALDATTILKYIVGKSQSYIKSDEDKIIANVLTKQNSIQEMDDPLNTRDATQILRKIVGQPSIIAHMEEEVEAALIARAAAANP